jgi:ATPase subunit of ABC transporter with duplicated ATPase domains
VPSGRAPLEIKHLSKSYDDLKVISNFSANITRGEKIAFTGRSGAGKTTMLKSIIRNAGQFIGEAEHKFKIDSGNVIWGHEVTVGYFPQDFSYTIDKSKGISALDWLWQFKAQAPQEEIRGALGQMLFSGEDALKPTSGLSGGECARLIFCKLMIQKPNFLVLDEPTNNLDLESNNALNIALQKYEGTVLLVTHDEDVLDEVATRVWHFQGGKIEDFKGTYEDFQSRTQKPVGELAKGRK